ncbi:MAG: sigma-70 family RNA polymerase sigma factor [Verrucomicrobiales bacterium]
MSKSAQQQEGNAGFPQTRWTLVVDLRGGDTRRRRALEELCRAYWLPLYAYARRCGHSPQDAEDLTQQFFAHLVEKAVFSKADPKVGKLRSFLLTSFRNLIAGEHRKARAEKRGGKATILPIDAAAAERQFAADFASAEGDPEREFHRRWALTVVERAVRRLHKDAETKGESEAARVEALSPFLTGIPDGESYATVAARLGVAEGTARVAVFRLRKRFHQILRDEIAETVADPDQVEGELGELVGAMAGC